MTVGTQFDAGHIGLVSRAQGGDLSAFEELVERHRDNVYGFGLRMTRSETEAAEITQESFLSACLRLAQFRNETDFIVWVYRTEANQALLRPGSARNAPVADPMATPLQFNESGLAQCRPDDWSDLVDEKVLDGGLRRAIEEATDGLPLGHREVLFLKDVAGLGYDQIAGINGVSIPTIKRRLHEARLYLRATIERFCIDNPDGRLSARPQQASDRAT